LPQRGKQRCSWRAASLPRAWADQPLSLEPDELEAFERGGAPGRPGSGEWVEDHSLRWRDQADQPAHQLDRLDCRMPVACARAPPVGGVLAGALARVTRAGQSSITPAFRSSREVFAQ
jgi:hypothetical protein